MQEHIGAWRLEPDGVFHDENESPPAGVAPIFVRRARIKEKIYSFLQAHPGGADSQELISILLKGAGSDPELGKRLIDSIIGDDPNFVRDDTTNLWTTRHCALLRVPLEEAKFVVVDLETTGGRPAPGSIIEIGAYRMRGRMIAESFQSLVRPSMRIPRFVANLTSICNEMVTDAPPIEVVLPAFRDFLGDSVMVAHNAQFDRSFLDLEFRHLFGIGLTNPVLCTLRLARRLLPSIKRRRLDLLAEHFGLSTEGRHRGLGDARMAAELLSIFLEIAAQMGLNRLDRLIDTQHRGFAGRRIERHVPPERIAAIPSKPGVYLMHNERGDVLYVGKATCLKERVSSYFNGGMSLNAKTAELVSRVWDIQTRVTRSGLDAAMTEARLIRELKPPYNRVLKSAARAYFIRIDMMDEFPRLAIAQRLSAKTGMVQLGPFIGRRKLDDGVRALARLHGLRTCSGPVEPNEEFSPCVYGQMGHCSAPCNASIADDAYNERAVRALAFLRGRSGGLLRELANAREHAAAAMRFEEARRRHRDLEALATLSERTTRMSRVVTENNVVIVFPAERGDLLTQVCAEGGTATGTVAVPPSASSGNGKVTEEEGGTPASSSVATAYVVLSGRLALVRDIDGAEAAYDVAAFVTSNYERYKIKPVVRGELENMAIVARWLKERQVDDGRLILLHNPAVDCGSLMRAAGLA